MRKTNNPCQLCDNRDIESLFSDRRKQSETLQKPQPIQPRQETILTVETAYICAACGKPDATILIAPVSYFGYIKLAHVRLCRSCHDTLIENQCNHHFHQRKEWPDTSIRLEAIQAAKQKSMRQA